MIDAARYIGKAEGELFTRLRQRGIRYRALDMAPRMYSADETERIIAQWLDILAEVVAEYDIDESRNWDVSMGTGHIYYLPA